MQAFSTKTKLIILSVIVVSLTGAGYFYFFQKPAEPLPVAPNPPGEKKSSADDEDYIQKRIDEILTNNPSAAKENARDVIYEEIAFNEQNESICGKIKSEKVKNHCYKLFLILK